MGKFFIFQCILLPALSFSNKISATLHLLYMTKSRMFSEFRTYYISLLTILEATLKSAVLAVFKFSVNKSLFQ